MDATTGATAQMVREVSTTVAGGVGLAGFLGIAVWMRKLIGLPKRVTKLEQTDVVVMRTLGALTKYLLASNQGRRGADKTPQMEAAESALTDADRALDEYLYQAIGSRKE